MVDFLRGTAYDESGNPYLMDGMIHPSHNGFLAPFKIPTQQTYDVADKYRVEGGFNIIQPPPMLPLVPMSLPKRLEHKNILGKGSAAIAAASSACSTRAPPIATPQTANAGVEDVVRGQGLSIEELYPAIKDVPAMTRTMIESLFAKRKDEMQSSTPTDGPRTMFDQKIIPKYMISTNMAAR